MIDSCYDHIPPSTPYVRMRMLMSGEKRARTKAMVAMTAPVMATGRHPNLFVRPDTIGPG